MTSLVIWRVTEGRLMKRMGALRNRERAILRCPRRRHRKPLLQRACTANRVGRVECKVNNGRRRFWLLHCPRGT